jgi:hypothetical protein
MMQAGGSAPAVAQSYQLEHPLEPIVTPDEIDAALAEAKDNAAKAGSAKVGDRQERPHRAKP